MDDLLSLSYHDLLPHHRAMLRDPALYPDAEVFRPERFEGIKFEGDAALLDPANVVFGFGRRCVLPTMLATLLLDLTRACDYAGRALARQWARITSGSRWRDSRRL